MAKTHLLPVEPRQLGHLLGGRERTLDIVALAIPKRGRGANFTEGEQVFLADTHASFVAALASMKSSSCNTFHSKSVWNQGKK